MTNTNTAPDPAPDDIAQARLAAIAGALVTEAFTDDGYYKELVVAAFNVIGIRSALIGTPLDGVIELMMPIARDARAHALPVVLQ